MKNFVILIPSCLMLLASWILVKSCRSHKEVLAITRAADIKYDSVKHYRDLYNTEHASVEQVTGDLLTANVLFRDQMDSVCKRLRIKQRQLEGMETVRATVAGTFTADVDPVTVHDTIAGVPAGWTGLLFKWQDSFLHIEGFVDSAKAVAHYSMDLPMKLNTYWRRRWFLGRKRHYIDAYSENPNVHISGLTDIKIN